MCRCSQADRYDILQVSVVQALGIQFEAESSLCNGFRVCSTDLMITIRFAGWISGRIVSFQPDTDIENLF